MRSSASVERRVSEVTPGGCALVSSGDGDDFAGPRRWCPNCSSPWMGACWARGLPTSRAGQTSATGALANSRGSQKRAPNAESCWSCVSSHMASKTVTVPPLARCPLRPLPGNGRSSRDLRLPRYVQHGGPLRPRIRCVVLPCFPCKPRSASDTPGCGHFAQSNLSSSACACRSSSCSWPTSCRRTATYVPRARRAAGTGESGRA